MQMIDTYQHTTHRSFATVTRFQGAFCFGTNFIVLLTSFKQIRRGCFTSHHITSHHITSRTQKEACLSTSLSLGEIPHILLILKSWA